MGRKSLQEALLIAFRFVGRRRELAAHVLAKICLDRGPGRTVDMERAPDTAAALDQGHDHVLVASARQRGAFGRPFCDGRYKFIGLG